MSENMETSADTYAVVTSETTVHGEVAGLPAGWATDVGERDTNQDAHTAGNIEVSGQKYQVYGVFDGTKSEMVSQFLASQLTSTISRFIDEEGVDGGLNQSFMELQAKLLNESKFNRQDITIGSTATVMVVGAKEVWIAHVGDSVAVVENTDGNITRVTSIDTKAEQRIAQGQAVLEGEQDTLTKAFKVPKLGVEVENNQVVGDAQPQIIRLDRNQVKRVVLASDGCLGEGKNIQDISTVLADNQDQKPNDVAKKIVSYSKLMGGTDNATAVVVDIN